MESEQENQNAWKMQSEQEVERLNRKLKRVMDEYAKCAKERDELRATIAALAKGKKADQD